MDEFRIIPAVLLSPLPSSDILVAALLISISNLLDHGLPDLSLSIFSFSNKESMLVPQLVRYLESNRGKFHVVIA